MNTIRWSLIGLIAPSVCLAMVHAVLFKEADEGPIRSMVDQAIVRLNRGMRVAGRVQVAFKVDDSTELTQTLKKAGANVVAEVRRTPGAL